MNYELCIGLITHSASLACHVVLHLLEEAGGEDKVVESLVVAGVDLLFRAHPLAIAFVDEDNVLSYSQHGVHVVGVDNGRDVVFLRDVGKQFVDKD